MAALEKIFQLLDVRPDLEDRPGALELPRIEGEIAFQDISFAYASPRRSANGSAGGAARGAPGAADGAPGPPANGAPERPQAAGPAPLAPDPISPAVPAGGTAP